MANRRILVFVALLLGCRASVSSADPILTPLDPAIVATMASVSGDHPTAIRFVNTLDIQVDVWWRSYSGDDVFYNSLRPLESYLQLTFVTHPWLIRSHADSVALVGFLPLSEPATANIVRFAATIPTPTPEPATVFSIASALACLGVGIRRRWIELAMPDRW